MREPRWTEVTGPGGTSLAIDLVAVDVARTEEQELDAFRRALAVPEQERDILVNDLSGEPISSLRLLHAAYVAAGLLIAGLATSFLSSFADELGHSLNAGTLLGLFFGFLFTPLLLFAWLRLRGRPRSSTVKDRFTLALDGAGFAVNGARTPLPSIERFEGQRRMSLVTKDGARTPLAFTLDTPAENEELAARLNDALRDVRANAGYRGVLLRVEEEAEPAADEPDEGHAEEMRGRS